MAQRRRALSTPAAFVGASAYIRHRYTGSRRPAVLSVGGLAAILMVSDRAVDTQQSE